MVLLQDLLNAPEFCQAANDLASEFRASHRLPPLHQLGLVVPDVEQAAGSLEAQGVARFFILSGAPVLWRERGKLRRVRGKMGVASYQGVELELLEPMQGSDFYRQHLDPQARPMVQHLGCLVEDVDEWADRLAATGSPVWIRGRLRAGPVKTDFAYMDTLAETGLILEFISWRCFGRTFRPSAGLLAGLARLERWLGRRSLSV
jgi:hypothetical protein